MSVQWVARPKGVERMVWVVERPAELGGKSAKLDSPALGGGLLGGRGG